MTLNEARERAQQGATAGGDELVAGAEAACDSQGRVSSEVLPTPVPRINPRRGAFLSLNRAVRPLGSPSVRRQRGNPNVVNIFTT